MDTLSHAGWGYALLRSKGRKAAWVGAAMGAAPDVLFFIPAKIQQISAYGWRTRRLGADPKIWRADGPPLPPQLQWGYDHLYVYTHSLVILAVVAGAFWLFRKKPWLPFLLPYALHIFMDVPTHERFLTPVLFPISRWTFQGVSWGVWWIFWPNWIALIACLIWVERRARRMPTAALRQESTDRRS